MTKKKYNIIVISDDHAEHKQFQLSKRLITVGLTLFLLLCSGLIFFGVSSFKMPFPAVKAGLERLKAENEELKLANERYLQASIEMEKKLMVFDEKTTKLAQYVGLETTGIGGDGIGGPDVLENELSRYLRYDLGLLEQKTELLEGRFDQLDQAFQTQTELLDSTPSLLPTRGWISSGFKYRTDPFTKKKTWHNGIDISSQKGTPVYAPAKGVVSFKGYKGGLGNLLEISHGSGLKTRYGHLEKFNVSKGQRVKRGDLIGYVGNTGRSTAPHLHYEIHKEDKAINPMQYIIRDSKTF